MKLGYICIGLAILSVNQSFAQCSHNPVVTPNNLILCPNETDTLFTIPGDSYQWYQNGNLLPGETQPFLLVDAVNFSATQVSVEVTLAGCAEMSPEVLVDGWAFLPPFAITDGDFTIVGQGEAHYCAEDTVLLILGNTGSVNIQWYESSTPIPGANDDTLFIDTTGFYTVSCSPDVCPDYVHYLGVTVYIEEHNVPVPQIAHTLNGLECSPGSGYGFQWSFNGTPIPNSDMAIWNPTQAGDYTVTLIDSIGCSATSVPFTFQFTGLEPNPGFNWHIFPNPVHTGFTYLSDEDASAAVLRILSTDGRVVWQGTASSGTFISLKDLTSGLYLLQQEIPGKALNSQRFIKL